MGGKSFKFLPFSVAGLPDRIAILPGGRIFFAEMKSEDEEPSKVQKQRIKELTDLGCTVYVIDKKATVDFILSCYA